VIDAGAIFREALKAGAEEIIVAHNHTSGDPTPSKADCETQEKHFSPFTNGGII